MESIWKAILSFRHQINVIILTFFTFSILHATKETTSSVKTVLHPKTSYFLTTIKDRWAPFNSSDGINMAFLSTYSFVMFFAGYLGDWWDLRVLLTVGMVGTGVCTSLFGLGYWLNIHSFYYYLAVQMLTGLFQSSGWPSVVAVIGNWFRGKKKGVIMGLWKANTLVGKYVIAPAFLKFGLGWSFVVPGLLIAFVGFVVFLFLPVSPEAVGFKKKKNDAKQPPVKRRKEGRERAVGIEREKNDVEQPLMEMEGREEGRERAVGFMKSWRIPGVWQFALSHFFSKLAAHTFLHWLPFYISHTAIDGQSLPDSTASTLSTIFDCGGVFGGILAGFITDHCGVHDVITAARFTYCGTPAVIFYLTCGNISLCWNFVLMFVAGMFVDGPSAFITTSVSANLGTHDSLGSNSRALATVTAIIKGTGSLGALVSRLLKGYISPRSWGAVFMMLMAAILEGGLLLTSLELAGVAAIKIKRSTEDPSAEEQYIDDVAGVN